LAQVRRFASLSQGTVTAESVVGQGSSVILRLPRATRAVSQSLLDQAAGQLAGPCWLLFVEDDLLVAQVMFLRWKVPDSRSCTRAAVTRLWRCFAPVRASTWYSPIS